MTIFLRDNNSSRLYHGVHFHKTKNEELQDHYETMFSLHETIINAQGVQNQQSKDQVSVVFVEILEKVLAYIKDKESRGKTIPKSLSS